jgi:c-di-AMP phosphodiesterase-like protein
LSDVRFVIFLSLGFIDQLQFYVIIDHSRRDDAFFLGGIQET